MKPMRLLMSEESERALGEWLLRSPFRVPLLWLVERLADLCCRLGMHAYPKQRTLESDDFCLHCARRRKT